MTFGKKAECLLVQSPERARRGGAAWGGTKNPAIDDVFCNLHAESVQGGISIDLVLIKYDGSGGGDCEVLHMVGLQRVQIVVLIGRFYIAS